MNSVLSKFLIGLVLAAGGILIILVILSRRSPELGLVGGALRPCPGSPNCVSSLETDDVHGTEPLWTGAEGDAAWLALQRILGDLANVRVVKVSSHYLHAEFTSRVLLFVDDVEFHLDSRERRIDVRSASRVGHSDLGANRARVDALRADLAAALQ